MSSTNRSNTRDSHIADYYVTPVDEVFKFLNEMTQAEPNILQGNILDSCAGGDVNHPMSYVKALNDIGIKNIDTIDIREDSLAEVKGDYLKLNCKNKYKLIVTNPPFKLAREVIEKALDDVIDGGFVIMLLRLNFLGSKQRFDMWQKQLPKYIFVHHKRMSFTDNGKTDSIEYAHFVWQKGCCPDFSQLKVI